MDKEEEKRKDIDALKEVIVKVTDDKDIIVYTGKNNENLHIGAATQQLVGDPTTSIALGVALMYVGYKTFYNDIANKWGRDINVRETQINDKYKKEVTDIHKSLGSQQQYLKDRYNDTDAKKKTEELKVTIDKVLTQVDKDRTKDLETIWAEKATLKQAVEHTKGMAPAERKAEIQKIWNLEKEKNLNKVF